MTKKEKECQRALGTLNKYIVRLNIYLQPGRWRIIKYTIETGNSTEAFDEAVRRCVVDYKIYRRDQISLRDHKLYD